MLGSRRIQTKVLDTNRESLDTKACPQSGVLSQIIWTIVVDELLAVLNQGGYPPHAGLCSRYSPGGAREMVSFTRKKEGLCIVCILWGNDERVAVSDSVKYLEIILGNDLTWNKQL